MSKLFSGRLLTNIDYQSREKYLIKSKSALKLIALSPLRRSISKLVSTLMAAVKVMVETSLCLQVLSEFSVWNLFVFICLCIREKEGVGGFLVVTLKVLKCKRRKRGFKMDEEEGFHLTTCGKTDGTIAPFLSTF